MKKFKLKWAYFEPLYSVFLNTQNSSKIMFKKSCKRYIAKRNHAQRIHLKNNTCSVLVTTPPPPTKSNGSPRSETTPCLIGFHSNRSYINDVSSVHAILDC